MDAEQRRRQYVRQLEAVVRQMLVPLKGVPFNMVIEAMTGHRVVDFDSGNGAHRKIFDVLVEAGRKSVFAINAAGGISSARPNEVGNYVEPYVKAALNALSSVSADTPTTASGKRKSTGYPDIEAKIDETVFYVECKTYNRRNVSTTQRSFYLSPSEEFKVTCDALHFLLAFEIDAAKAGRYKANGFKLLTLDNLSLDVKHEFNSDNRRLYSGTDGARLLYTETDMLQ
ncbi:MAG: hypothetical protein HXY29_00825 [Rhodocyclaceae bacterium]|jgi:Holliday junction resolvase|nr:hypothetical protein [Rhodocyclaceae bacterium]